MDNGRAAQPATPLAHLGSLAERGQLFNSFLGVAGTLRDWHDFLVGFAAQPPPHLVIDLAGTVVFFVLVLSGRGILGSNSFVVLLVLFLPVALPYVLLLASRGTR